MSRYGRYIIILSFLWGSLGSRAQDFILSQKFSFNFSQLKIESVLDSISSKTGFGFSYGTSAVEGIGPITAGYQNVSLKEILQDLLAGRNLNYKVICNYIVIAPKLSEVTDEDIFSNYTDTTGFFYLKARVMDARAKDAVPFANVVLKGKSIGTVTNADGYFTLKIPSGCFNDTLLISFIGYKTLRLNINNVPPGALLNLQPVSVQLNEVIVNHYDPRDLILLSLKKVPDNYSSNQELQIGFYRETSRQNNDYIVNSEAVLKILKSAYNKDFRTDQVLVYKNRKNPFVKTMDTVLYKLQGGIYNCLMIDLAKYPASFMSTEYFDMYKYSFEGMTQYNDQLVYVISFDQSDGVPYPLYKGKLFIEKESLAIVKAEFEVSPEGLKYATSLMVKKTTSNLRVRVVEAKYLVNYTMPEDKWRLHHVREEVKIKVRKKLGLFNSTFNSISELVITDSDTATISRFKSSELVKPSQIFADFTSQYDESFWGKFNFIQPEISLEEAYQKRKKALEAKK